MKTVMKKTSMAVAAAAMISGASVTTVAQADEALGKCHGANACKGQTVCATADNACAGQNSCKGTGWLKLTEKACAEKGGKFEAKK